MVKKRKQVNGTAQEVGNPGKHLQFRKDPSGNPRDRPRGFQKPQRLPYGSRSPPSLRPPNDFEATSNGD